MITDPPPLKLHQGGKYKPGMPEMLVVQMAKRKYVRSFVQCIVSFIISDIFFENLASVFRSWLFHGTVIRSLLAYAFMPLL